MKILWMSRHKPVLSQIKELQKLFGTDVVVEQDPRPFDSAEQIVKRYKVGNYQDIVVVAPLSVLAKMCELGLKPLWADAAEETNERRIEYRGARGKGFRFIGFKRVSRIELVFEEVLK